MNPTEVAEAIKIPLSLWPGRCYTIASMMLQAKLVRGKLRYGDWIGPVVPDTLFYERWRARPFIHHGWIEKPGRSVCIIDPTRWVFEGEEPYIYEGPNDHYDPGGNVWREQSLSPPPSFDDDEKVFPTFPSIPLVEQFLGPPPYSFGQVIWLANLPLKMLGREAKLVYQAIIQYAYPSMIPLDNREIVLGRKCS